MRWIKKISFLFFFLVRGSGAWAQCCTSGNPFISDAEQPALQSKILTASLAYRYSHSGSYYSQDGYFKELPFQEAAYSNYTELQLGYGVTNWLTVLSELGYLFNKTFETPGIDSYKGYGLGDAALYLKFNGSEQSISIITSGKG